MTKKIPLTCRKCKASFRTNVRGARYCEECHSCSVSGCDRSFYKLAYCSMHYHRMKRSGDFGSLEYRRLPNGRGAGVDVHGYRIIMVNKVACKEHRVVMERVLGRKLLTNENVHHLDGDRLNNDPSNLELWVKTQPCGQRASDKAKASIKFLREHPELAAAEGVRLITLESQESTDLMRDDGFNKFAGVLSALA